MDRARAAADRAREALSARGGVVAAYLFGSVARGAAAPNDLDVAVMFDQDVDAFAEVLAVQVELERFTEFAVDVHDFDRLPSDLQFRVLDEGSLLVDARPMERTRRAVAAQLAFYDFKPYLDRIVAGAVHRVASGARG